MNNLNNLLRELEEHSEKKAELKLQLDSLQNKISEIHNQILHFQSEINLNTEVKVDLKEYKKSSGVPTKVFYVLKKNQKCLTGREILDLITVYDNVSLDKHKDRYLMMQVLDCLNRYYKKGELNRFKPLYSKEWTYGFSTWFDDNGILKANFK